jgi:hypothetical protein
MRRGADKIRGAVILFLIALSITTVAATSIKTTDFLGNLKSDYSPEEIVYIRGYDFEANALIFLDMRRPDGIVQKLFSFSDAGGNFLAIYDLDGIRGDYLIVANDGVNILSAYFSDSAIWTTKNDCGNEAQDTNHYSIGDEVYINGDGFAAGTYDWSITGKPGGASCDPGTIVASGNLSVNASGSFCINAYNVTSGDCGEYQVKFGVKGDNYRVTGNICTSNADCGSDSSILVCAGNTVINTTTIPECINANCTLTTINQTIKACDFFSSNLQCIGDNLVNITTIGDCAEGDCFNITNQSLIRTCTNGSSQLVCIGLDVYNQSLEGGCANGQCLNGTSNIFVKSCANGSSQLVCIGLDVYNQSTGGGCLNGECLNVSNSSFVENCGNTSSEIKCIGNDSVNATTIPKCLNGNCSEDEIVTVLEHCLFGCLNGNCLCEDTDNDGVCNTDDNCTGTKPNEIVDEEGCSNPQFCVKQGECGEPCDLADWKGNEQNVTRPHDCMTILVHREGTLMPYCAGMTCAD